MIEPPEPAKVVDPLKVVEPLPRLIVAKKPFMVLPKVLSVIAASAPFGRTARPPTTKPVARRAKWLTEPYRDLAMVRFLQTGQKVARGRCSGFSRAHVDVIYASLGVIIPPTYGSISGKETMTMRKCHTLCSENTRPEAIALQSDRGSVRIVRSLLQHERFPDARPLGAARNAAIDHVPES